jgi:hypothetical protein
MPGSVGFNKSAQYWWDPLSLAAMQEATLASLYKNANFHRRPVREWRLCRESAVFGDAVSSTPKACENVAQLETEEWR